MSIVVEGRLTRRERLHKRFAQSPPVEVGPPKSASEMGKDSAWAKLSRKRTQVAISYLEVVHGDRFGEGHSWQDWMSVLERKGGDNLLAEDAGYRGAFQAVRYCEDDLDDRAIESMSKMLGDALSEARTPEFFGAPTEAMLDAIGDPFQEEQ